MSFHGVFLFGISKSLFLACIQPNETSWPLPVLSGLKNLILAESLSRVSWYAFRVISSIIRPLSLIDPEIPGVLISILGESEILSSTDNISGSSIIFNDSSKVPRPRFDSELATSDCWMVAVSSGIIGGSK